MWTSVFQTLEKRVVSPRGLVYALLAGTALWAKVAIAEEGATASAQSWLVKTWHDEDGLPANIINAIAQTPDGYLWLATPAGLVRFDGTDTQLIREQTPVFPKHGITTLCADHAGRLWLGYWDGAVAYFDAGMPAPHIVATTKAKKPITCIMEDEHGCKWLGQPGGYSQLRANGEVVAHKMTPELKDSDRFEFVRDGQGRLWGVGGRHLYLLENDKFVIRRSLMRFARIARATSGRVPLVMG